MTWQPLDTVPRDGTVVDLWHKTGGRITEQWWIPEEDCWSCLLQDCDFTHWMRIPDGPQSDRDSNRC